MDFREKSVRDWPFRSSATISEYFAQKVVCYLYMGRSTVIDSSSEGKQIFRIALTPKTSKIQVLRKRALSHHIHLLEYY